MKKIKERAKKGTISVRKRNNGYEARITLDIDGIKNYRLSRFSSVSEKEAKRKLGEAIAEAYIRASQGKGFNEEETNRTCSKSLRKLKEYNNEDITQEIISKAKESNKFNKVAFDWLEKRRQETMPNRAKRLSSKTFEQYVYNVKSNLIPAFGEYLINEITKEMFQNYIDNRNAPKMARDNYITMKQIMDFARQQNLISINPIVDIVLPPKRKKEISYLTSEEQVKWLDCAEQDGRDWALLFATIIQTGMRPEERLWLEMEMCKF